MQTESCELLDSADQLCFSWLPANCFLRWHGMHVCRSSTDTCPRAHTQMHAQILSLRDIHSTHKDTHKNTYRDTCKHTRAHRHTQAHTQTHKHRYKHHLWVHRCPRAPDQPSHQGPERVQRGLGSRGRAAPLCCEVGSLVRGP